MSEVLSDLVNVYMWSESNLKIDAFVTLSFIALGIFSYTVGRKRVSKQHAFVCLVIGVSYSITSLQMMTIDTLYKSVGIMDIVPTYLTYTILDLLTIIIIMLFAPVFNSRSGSFYTAAKYSKSAILIVSGLFANGLLNLFAAQMYIDGTKPNGYESFTYVFGVIGLDLFMVFALTYLTFKFFRS